jgi:hypothetical protein
MFKPLIFLSTDFVRKVLEVDCSYFTLYLSPCIFYIFILRKKGLFKHSLRKTKQKIHFLIFKKKKKSLKNRRRSTNKTTILHSYQRRQNSPCLFHRPSTFVGITISTKLYIYIYMKTLLIIHIFHYF